MLDLSDIKVGDFLLTQSGEVCKVIDLYEGDTYPIDTSSTTYNYEGRRYESKPNDLDIIATVPPAVMFEFYRILNQYHTCDSFKIILDNCYKNHIDKKEI